MFKIKGEGEVHVGSRCHIADSATIVFSKPGKVSIGDYCRIGDNVKIVVSGGDVTIDDWTTLHDGCLVLSTAGARIGQHCWFGQNCIIDGSGGIDIGSGVRVGMYSQLWSHVAAGEQIEGCTLFGFRPVVLRDNVWLVGSCIVASGVELGERLVALIGSNITKSFPANITIAGSPASVKDKLNFYTPITLPEKLLLLDGWLEEYRSANPTVRLERHEDLLVLHGEKGEMIGFAGTSSTAATQASLAPDSTVCCIETKTYLKQLSDLEESVLRELSSNRARFKRVERF